MFMASGLQNISYTVKKYEDMKNALKQEVFGQDRVIEEIISSIANAELYEEADGRRPRGIFLLAGPPGVGKTFLTQCIAEQLGYPSLTLDMSNYNQREDSKIALFGLDASWKASREGTLLKFIDDQRGNPCVLILDEFEKAHPEVIVQFLQILESARAENVYIKSAKLIPQVEWDKKGIPSTILSRSDVVSFSNVFIFFTTNAGRPLYENGKQPKPDLTKDAIIDAIRKDINPATKVPYFPDAILSRLQTGTVAMFRHLNTDEILSIGNKEMVKTFLFLRKKHQLEVVVEKKIATLLLLREGGLVDGRNFRKLAESFVRDQISELGAILKGDQKEIRNVQIIVDPEQRASLDELLYGEERPQDVILVCEDENQYDRYQRIFKRVDGLRVSGTTDYAEAIDMIRNEVFDTPLIYAVMPTVPKDVGLTMAAVNNVLKSRGMKEFKDFVDKAKKANEKASLFVIGSDQCTPDAGRELLARGVTEILSFADEESAVTLVEKKAEGARLNHMAFDFARKGKALKFDTAPAVEKDTAYVRLRDFEKIDNIKSGDDDFLVGQERMPNVSFSQVVGGDTIKEEAEDFISFLRNPKHFVGKGLKAPKGLLFYGPAGTGKTHMAKAIAHEAGVPFIAAGGGEIRMGNEMKNGAELLKQYFAIARRYAPSILFIDEMETIALNRTGRDPGADTLVNTLLAEMDGFDGHDSNPVVVIGATNAGIDEEHAVNGRVLDPAVVRRFSRKFLVGLPGKADRLEHLYRELKDWKISKDELETASQMSFGLSFGNLNNAIEIAKRQVIREGRELIRKDIENAIETVSFGEKKTQSPEFLERTAYHEAGHACIRCVLGGAYMPDHATVVSRGNLGGYVITVGDEDGQIQTKTHLENKIRAALAGRCAEELHYGRTEGLSTGPSSDIAKAYDMIRAMVCRLGMDEEIGMAYYPPAEDGANVMPDKVLDRINVLLKKYYEEAAKMLEEHKGLLEEIARELIQHESLSRSDLERITERYAWPS